MGLWGTDIGVDFKISVLKLWLPHAYGFIPFQLQNFKLIWLWRVFVTNCFKLLVILIICMMACYFPFWCLHLIVMLAFRQKYKKMFSCVLHTANTLTCFERSFFLYKKNIGSFENVFSHGFLKHQKLFFLHFWILQHVCKTPKGIGQYSKKYKNLIFGGNSSIIHR